ncbi:S8 family serine peptidase [Stackebrandtia endophytica]|uniref:S8 family serine peptidase n=1 Tax=Stackebrandtia endophytica TaxID=1496996 RepID=UPI0014769672|nr:S8 family serine peptidase [Stackebrandtia endophytica]
MRSRKRVSAAVAAVVLAITLAPTSAAQAEPASYDWNLGDDTARITLVTGDQVTIKATDGKASPKITPAPGRESVPIHISNHDGNLYVIPADAGPLIAAGTLDRRLFDVTTLVEQGYADEDRADIPLIVRTGNDLATTTDARPLGGLGLVAAEQPKAFAVDFWEQVTGARVGTLAAGVDEIWLDGRRTVSLDSSVPQIGAPEAWEAGYTGDGVTVAVLDTGIDVDHPDVADRIVGSQDFTGTDIGDRVGHGTHVAATIAGTGDASDGKYTGVAPDTDLLIGKVCADVGCEESAILSGMQWAAESGATAVNVSLGGFDSPEIDPLEQAVADLTEQYGTLFVVSAGNSGGNQMVESPGSATDALTVGAVDRNDELAEFSSRGPRIGDFALKPDITAPGVDIVAARAAGTEMGEPVGDRYVAASGTSMATPHVVGAVALLSQQHPDWTGAELKAALMGSAAPNPDLLVHEQGAGRVDAAAAVGQQLTAQPASLSAGLFEWPQEDVEPVDKTVTYHNPTEEAVTLNLEVSGVGPDGTPVTGVFGLDGDTVEVPARGEAEVVVTIDPSGDLPAGNYGGTILAASDLHTVSTPVLAVLEPESYDLTVTAVGRDGEAPEGGFGLTLMSVNDSDVYISAWFEETEGTLRVPVGEYHSEVTVYGGLGDDETLSKIVRPAMSHTEAADWAVDASDAQPIVVDIDAPDVTQRAGFFGYVREFAWGSYQSMMLADDFGSLFTAVDGPAAPEGSVTTEASGHWKDSNGATFYDVGLAEPGLTDGFTSELTESDFAAVDITIRSQHDGSQSELIWWLEGPLGGYGFGTEVDTPSTLTGHHNLDDYWTWRGEFSQNVVNDDDVFSVTQEFIGPFDHEAGETHEQVWNSGIFGPGFAAVGTGMHRDGTRLEIGMPLFSGPGLHQTGYSAVDSGRTALYQGDELIGEFDHVDYGTINGLPEEEREYRLVIEADRSTVSTVSTSIAYEWTFTFSAEDPEPTLLAVRMAPQGLDEYNRAEVGEPVTIPVTVDSTGTGEVDRCDLSVEVSFDGGHTWEVVEVDDGAITVTAESAGSVSLRSNATDEAGNSVSQTVIDAYLVA